MTIGLAYCTTDEVDVTGQRRDGRYGLIMMYMYKVMENLSTIVIRFRAECL